MAYPVNRVFSSLLLVAALCAWPLQGRAAAQVTFPANPATLGPIPDSVGEVGTDGPPLLVSIPVSGGVGGVTTVSVSMTMTHTWMGEVTATLISPNGTTHVIYGRTLATTPTDWGTANDLNGTYSFRDAAGGNFWTAAMTDSVAPGAYRTSTIGGTPGSTGTVTTMNTGFLAGNPMARGCCGSPTRPASTPASSAPRASRSRPPASSRRRRRPCPTPTSPDARPHS